MSRLKGNEDDSRVHLLDSQHVLLIFDTVGGDLFVAREA